MTDLVRSLREINAADGYRNTVITVERTLRGPDDVVPQGSDGSNRTPLVGVAPMPQETLSYQPGLRRKVMQFEITGIVASEVASDNTNEWHVRTAADLIHDIERALMSTEPRSDGTVPLTRGGQAIGTKVLATAHQLRVGVEEDEDATKEIQHATVWVALQGECTYQVPINER